MATVYEHLKVAARLRRGWLANSAWYRVATQRGWEALRAIGWSIQKPRPKNPKSATPEEVAAFEKARGCNCRRGGEVSRQADRGLRHGRAPHRP
jgi:hypothetical protein